LALPSNLEDGVAGVSRRRSLARVIDRALFSSKDAAHRRDTWLIPERDRPSVLIFIDLDDQRPAVPNRIKGKLHTAPSLGAHISKRPRKSLLALGLLT